MQGRSARARHAGVPRRAQAAAAAHARAPMRPHAVPKHTRQQRRGPTAGLQTVKGGRHGNRRAQFKQHVCPVSRVWGQRRRCMWGVGGVVLFFPGVHVMAGRAARGGRREVHAPGRCRGGAGLLKSSNPLRGTQWRRRGALAGGNASGWWRAAALGGRRGGAAGRTLAPSARPAGGGPLAGRRAAALGACCFRAVEFHRPCARLVTQCSGTRRHAFGA
jgi:hypothetical protein